MNKKLAFLACIYFLIAAIGSHGDAAITNLGLALFSLACMGEDK